MTLLAGYTILMGTMLGLRYRVFVLPPVILLGGVLIIAISAQPWSSALIFAFLLQLSYLAGMVLKGSTRGSIPQPVDAISGANLH